MASALSETDENLFSAVRANNLDWVRAAIMAGANVNSRGSNNRTPLFYAASLADVTVIRLLLDEKADPNLDDDSGMTPLHEAVINMRNAHALTLIEGGADINYQSGKKPAPIHSAFFEDLRHDDTARSRFMVANGADLSVTMQRSMGEWTVYEIARDLAIKFPHAEVILRAMIEMEQKMKTENDATEKVQNEATDDATAKEASTRIAKVHSASIGIRNRYKL